jgi:hypothetical protein
MEARAKARDRRYCRAGPQMERAARSANLNGPWNDGLKAHRNYSSTASRVKPHQGAAWQSSR